MMSKTKLSKAIGAGKYDNAVNNFINEYWSKHFQSPSLREISDHCNMHSISFARFTVRRLAKYHDYLLAETGTARGVTPRWVRDAITRAAKQTRDG